jgi:hypothetical protein
VSAPATITPIGQLQWRSSSRIRGRIRSVRVQPWAEVGTLECVVIDDTGGVLLVFLGRRSIPGLELGRLLEAEGTVGEARGYLSILNPKIEFLGN